MNKRPRISKYYRLPKVLMDIIWSYDDRYRNEFNQTVMELNRYFNHNRIIDSMKFDQTLFEIYMDINRNRNRTIIFTYPKYVLSKHKLHRNVTVSIDDLKSVSLRTRYVVSENKND